jgi:hypothetical protein
VTKTKAGENPPYEAIVISTIAPDDDGSLKIKYMEEFVDSKTKLELLKAFAAAQA